MDYVAILSLIVAALAVFVGPIISAKSAKRAMLGPMRQEWINNLRSLLSEISSKCLHYYQTGYEDRTEKEYQHITDLEHQIIFIINPKEPMHQELIKTIREMVNALESGKKSEEKFISSYKNLLENGRTVLKAEWNVVKEA